MATTHIWFLNPCLGPNRPWAGQAASPAPAALEAGGTEVLGRGTQPLLGPRSPGTEGKRDTGLPGRRGRGRQSPEFPPLNTWVWKRLLGTEHRAQLAARLLFGQLCPSRWGGRSLKATPRRYSKALWKIPFGICVAASWVNTSKDGEVGAAL